MDIAIGLGESLEPICFDTDIVDLTFEDTNEKRMVLVIRPCTCEIDELESGEINSIPELN